MKSEKSERCSCSEEAELTVKLLDLIAEAKNSLQAKKILNEICIVLKIISLIATIPIIV